MFFVSLIELPDQSRIRISGGLSALIAKGLIEDFARLHLERPQVLWFSTSERKSIPQFDALSASIGLNIDVSTDLPDLILIDMAASRFHVCEIVASDGAVTEKRKTDLLAMLKTSKISADAIQFVSAFEDRNSPEFRKNFIQIALESSVWFRTEPELLVVLTMATRDELSP